MTKVNSIYRERLELNKNFCDSSKQQYSAMYDGFIGGWQADLSKAESEIIWYEERLRCLPLSHPDRRMLEEGLSNGKKLARAYRWTIKRYQAEKQLECLKIEAEKRAKDLSNWLWKVRAS